MERLPEELNAAGQRIPIKNLNPQNPPKPSEGYGSDPNVITPPVSGWPRILSRHQLRLIAALSDVVLPGTADHPPPSEVGMAAFFDEWLSAPYQTQQNDKALILPGLDYLDQESRRLFWFGFLYLPRKWKHKVIDATIAAGGNTAKFFFRFRTLLVGAYFTSDAGFKAIGYLGNVPLRNYAAVPAEVQRIIDDELLPLGL
jgi:hypothetical protein